jgi:hypothetical protein
MPKLILKTIGQVDEEYSITSAVGLTESGSGLELRDGNFEVTAGNVEVAVGNVQAVNGTFSSAVSATSVSAATGNFSSQVTATLGTFTSVSAPFKLFDIEHPSKENKRLIHACLEGPELGVYFRGKTNKNEIEFPDYWRDLVDENSITVHLTRCSLNQPSLMCSGVMDNKALVHGANGYDYFFIVYGERKDLPKLQIEIDEE